jgi:hypothetical protein
LCRRKRRAESRSARVDAVRRAGRRCGCRRARKARSVPAQASANERPLRARRRSLRISRAQAAMERCLPRTLRVGCGMQRTGLRNSRPSPRNAVVLDLVVLHQGCSLRMLTLRLKPLQGSELYNWRCNALNYRVPTHNCCSSPSPLLALQRS